MDAMHSLHTGQVRRGGVVGRGSCGLGSTVEYLGSRCAAEQGSLGRFWRGNKQVTTELQMVSGRASRRGAAVLFFLFFSVTASSLPFPFPYQLPVGQARLAKCPTSFLSACLSLFLGRDVLVLDRMSLIDVAVGRKARKLSPDLMMNGGKSWSSDHVAKR